MKLNEEEQKWLDEFDASEKKQTSYSGKRSYKEFSNPDKDIERRFDLDKLYSIGGNHIVMLYLCGSNFELAAKELGIKTNSLYRYIARLRSELIKKNVTKKKLKKFLTMSNNL